MEMCIKLQPLVRNPLVNLGENFALYELIQNSTIAITFFDKYYMSVVFAISYPSTGYTNYN